MLDSLPKSRREAAEAALRGDPHPLLQQLGSPAAMRVLGEKLGSPAPAVRDAEGLRQFLAWYETHVLGPRELPIIQQAYNHAARGHARELIALDHGLATVSEWMAIAEASQLAGRTHLRRLRPLKDLKLIATYWGAVEKGEAFGWHATVYGVILAVFALPLRQGLLHYARQSLGSFIRASQEPLRLSETTATLLTQAAEDRLPAVVNKAVSSASPQGFTIV